MIKAVSDYLKKHDTFEEKTLLVVSSFLELSFIITLILDIAAYEKTMLTEIVATGILVVLLPMIVSFALRKKRVRSISNILVAIILLIKLFPRLCPSLIPMNH